MGKSTITSDNSNQNNIRGITIEMKATVYTCEEQKKHIEDDMLLSVQKQLEMLEVSHRETWGEQHMKF